MEKERHIAVWENCLRIIEQNVEPQQFATWFRPIKPVALVESTLTIEVPTDYYRSYLESAFIDILSRSLRRELGSGAKLRYRISPVQGQAPITVDGVGGSTSTNRPIPVSTPRPFGMMNVVFPEYKKLQIETKLPGGETSGYTGSIVGDPILKWNTQGTYRIELWGKDMTYENGLLKSVGNERLISEL